MIARGSVAPEPVRSLPLATSLLGGAASTAPGDEAVARPTSYEAPRGGPSSGSDPASSISKSAKSKPGPTVQPTSA